MLKYVVNMPRDISSTANTSAPHAVATLLPPTNRCVCFLLSFKHSVDKVSFMIHLSHFTLYGSQRKPRKQ